jgi:hypothetical protein
MTAMTSSTTVVEATHVRSQRGRGALRGLALFAVLATVLASEPVHALAPPTAPAPSGGATIVKPSGTKPGATPQKPGQPKPGQPKPASTRSATASTPDAEPPATAPSGASKTSTDDAAKGTAAGKAAKTSAKAQAGAKGSGGGKGRTGTKGSAGAKGKSVIDEEFLIEGKLEKPNAYYILRRSSVDFDWARLGATFSPLVLESVQDPLF